MSKDQAYLLDQSYSFQSGLQDFRGGVQLDTSRSTDWQCGWKWANCKGVSRSK